MTYDLIRSRAVMFGGDPIRNPRVDDTWTYLDTTLLALPAQPAPGQPVALWLDSPRDPYAAYALACSFARAPGIPIFPDGRVLSLRADPLFFWSLGSLAPPFEAFFGLLDGVGRARATVWLPPEPALAGVRFLASGLTFDLAGPLTILNEAEMTIRAP